MEDYNIKNNKIYINSNIDTANRLNALPAADNGKNLQVVYIKDSKREESKSSKQKELFYSKNLCQNY